MGDCLISQLKHGDSKRRLCVRLSRMWEFFDTNDETNLLHLALVLVDETGNSIAAQIFPPCDKIFKPLLTEGKIYYLTYYRVRPRNKTYRPVANKFAISLTKWTVVEEYVEAPSTFPSYTYELKSFNEFPPLVDKKDSFIDTIGVITKVTSITSVRSCTRNADSLKGNVHMRDANNDTIHISLWGDRATEFPTEEVFAKGQQEPQIVIFVGTLVKGFRREIYLSGNNACKWYINIDYDEVESFRASMKDKHVPVKWLDLPPLNAIRAIAEQKTIVEIKDLNPFEYKKNEFVVTVTVKKIDGPWWYNACDKCKKTAKPYGYLYRCFGDDCPPTVPASPRFKLNLIAGDQTSDTKFVLFGRMAQRLIGKSVDILLNENPIDEEFIPKEIACLLEKEFTFNLSLTDTTVSTGNVCFQVNNILTGNGPQNQLLLMSPSPSQASAKLPLLAMSPAASEGFSTGQASIANTPSVGFNSPLVTPTKGIDVASECSSKKGETKASAIMEDEDDNATLAALKVAGLSASQSTSKATKKRSRVSPRSNAAKKLFKDDNDGQDEASAQEST